MKGRPKNRENAWRPVNVRLDKWGYIYDNRTTKEWVRLCGPNSSQAEVWERYEAMGTTKKFTLATVIEKYFVSPQYREGIKIRTQKDYRSWSAKVLAVFGEMHPDAIQSTQITQFMDVRGEYPTAANHERSFLSIVMAWGKARGYVTITNPCDSVKPIKLKKKELVRYYDDTDHAALLNYLGEKGYTMHQVALEIAYLCGSRQQDVLRLYDHKPFGAKPNDCYVAATGIVIWQAKTGKVQLKLFTPRLKHAVDLARQYKARRRQDGKLMKLASSPWLICTKSGSRYTRDGFNSNWIRSQAKALELGLISARFRFHDAKHKGITDFDGNKQDFSGHTTRGMMEHYNHGIDETETVDRPLDIDSIAGFKKR